MSLTILVFQSTPSAWRETKHPLTKHKIDDISIHSLRMEGDRCSWGCFFVILYISIHSLRMEGDTSLFLITEGGRYFNPLPPHGGRQQNNRTESTDSTFQSTPSAWRETVEILRKHTNIAISIHSLRMEGDKYDPFRWKW